MVLSQKRLLAVNSLGTHHFGKSPGTSWALRIDDNKGWNAYLDPPWIRKSAPQNKLITKVKAM